MARNAEATRLSLIKECGGREGLEPQPVGAEATDFHTKTSTASAHTKKSSLLGP
jgi:hypothetical protein